MSQSSPMVGWPICRRADDHHAGNGREQAGDGVRPDDALRHGDAAEFGGMRRAADGQDVAADADAVEQEGYA
jgi:hypothetical protein